MGTYRGNSGPGFLASGCLILACIFIPIVGHIILTVMILGDDLTSTEKLLWLILVWLVPVVGPLLYLLLGQKRNRLMSQL